MTDQGTACKFFFLLVKDENIDEDCINISVVYCKYESYEKKCLSSYEMDQGFSKYFWVLARENKILSKKD